MQPGDKIVSSVVRSGRTRTFIMSITSTRLGRTITTPYTLLRGQTGKESTAYFVLEHQPVTCRAYPTSGEMSFENIYVEVDGRPVESPQWQALEERPACDSKATVVDPKTIKFTWSASATAAQETELPGAPLKWAAPRPQL